MMLSGKQGDYYWLEAASASMIDALRYCSDLVLGKYLVITSFDSGPLRLTTEEFERGWMQHDDLAINPSVKSVSDIPFEQYDEWYIFLNTPLLEEFKVFVSDLPLTLRDPETFLSEADPTWDLVGIKQYMEQVRELQELFWLQLELKAVETYIAEGDRLILATKIREPFERLREFLSRSDKA